MSEPFAEGEWRLPGQAAIVLMPGEAAKPIFTPVKRRTA
jgi:hypothetical protein